MTQGGKRSTVAFLLRLLQVRLQTGSRRRGRKAAIFDLHAEQLFPEFLYEMTRDGHLMRVGSRPDGGEEHDCVHSSVTHTLGSYVAATCVFFFPSQKPIQGLYIYTEWLFDGWFL